MDMKISKKLFSDADICLDLLFSQEKAAESYVNFNSSCATKGLHEDVLSLMSEEARLHGEIYKEMLKRGFIKPQNATEELIDEVKELYKK